MSAQMTEVSLLIVGLGTVLRLERDAWSMVKRLRQATNEYPPHPAPPSRTSLLSTISLLPSRGLVDNIRHRGEVRE